MLVFYVAIFCLLGLHAKKIHVNKMSSLRNENKPIILIDPAGHVGNLGRLLLEGYERAQTLRFAHALKKEFLKKYNVFPVISRTSGELILPFQVPSFSNRLGTSLFLRIHMYREESEKPRLFFYQHLLDPEVDLAHRNFDLLSLIPIHQAHFSSAKKTKVYGEKICEYLNQKTFRRYFDCHQLLGIPLKSLVGITAPALLLEMGICRENKWKSLVGPIVESFGYACGFEKIT